MTKQEWLSRNTDGWSGCCIQSASEAWDAALAQCIQIARDLQADGIDEEYHGALAVEQVYRFFRKGALND